MAARRHVLLVGGSGLPELFAAVESRDLRAVLISVPEVLAGYRPPQCVDHYEAVDFRKPLQAVQRILKINRRFPLAGVVPVSEFGLEVSAAAAQIRGLPSNLPAAVRATQDKVLTRKTLAAAGLDSVRFAACDGVAEATRFMAEVEGPIIVKARSGTGSDGVSRVESPNDLPAAFAAVSRSLIGGGVVCEEFLEGPEVSLEGAFSGGRFVPVAFTGKEIDDRFVEVGHNQPSDLPSALRQQMSDLTAELMAALGVDHGACHTEFKLTADGPRLVETHTRAAGGNIPRITELTTGVDLIDVMVAAALGEKPECRPTPTGRAAAVRWLLADRPGSIASLRLPEPRREAGEVEAGAWVREGTCVSGQGGVGNQIAYAIGEGQTAEIAKAAAQRLLAGVRADIVEDKAS